MKKILIVDDNLEVRHLLRLTLAAKGYEIGEAADGVDALWQIRGWQPDLVLLDIMMPGTVDGLQVCRRIKEDEFMWHTLIVLLTARGQQSDVKAGLEAGADAYLIKPFSPMQMVGFIEEILQKAINPVPRPGDDRQEKEMQP